MKANLSTAELAASQELLSECAKALVDYRNKISHTKIENDRAIAKSRETLNRSWLLLTTTHRMARR